MSRVKKFKDYRNSLQNSSEDVLLTQANETHKATKDNEKIVRKETDTLSTLSISYDEIMEATKEADEKDLEKELQIKRYRTKSILKIVGIALACAAIIAIIVVIGIYLF